jgi:adenylate cyclase class IV
MQTEYELKILNITTTFFEQKLMALWATKQSEERLMRRYVYEMKPKQDGTRLRLRDDWNAVTLTIKQVKAHTIDGTQELEVIIEDFKIMHTMLIMMWYEVVTYQENKRISRLLDGCDIEIDTRPMLETYAEIEWASEKNVLQVLEKLGYDVSETTAVKVKQMYEAKGVDLHSIERLVFE